MNSNGINLSVIEVISCRRKTIGKVHNVKRKEINVIFSLFLKATGNRVNTLLQIFVLMRVMRGRIVHLSLDIEVSLRGGFLSVRMKTVRLDAKVEKPLCDRKGQRNCCFMGSCA